MKIMAVDNNIATLAELVSCLNEVYPESDIVEFTNPLLAAQYLYQHCVDMVYTETMMRNFNGVGLLDWLRNKNSGIPMVFVTSRAEYKERALAAGAAAYILKPITTEEIRGTSGFWKEREIVHKSQARSRDAPNIVSEVLG